MSCGHCCDTCHCPCHTPQDLTAAVEAGARVQWERQSGRPWEDVPETRRSLILGSLTPIITAALSAGGGGPR